jgi:ubiquinone/menaquinone biosynthesis C-methylase UbiE
MLKNTKKSSMENTHSVKNYFEETKNYLHKDFGVRLRKELLQEEIGKIEGREILDIGCGNGAISLPYVCNNNLTLLDFSENMLSLAKKSIPENKKKNVTLLNIDLFELPSDKKYDIILLIGVVAHLSQPLNTVLSFLSKRLNEGGKLYLQYSDKNNFISKIEKRIRKTPYPIKFLCDQDIQAVCKNINLVIIKKIQYGGVFPGMGLLPNEILFKYVKYITKIRIYNYLKGERILVLQPKKQCI